MLVSFIIPAYNARDTIERCLNSIYALPLKPDEFEVIVIDDCSADNTCEIVQNYTQSLTVGKGINNLTLLRQPENHRQGAARNRGVKIAKGEYICFVDADDAVTEGIVNAIRLAKEKDADMVSLHNASVNELGVITSEINRMDALISKEFSGIEMQNIYPYWCSTPWGYVYKHSFLEYVNYPFVEDAQYEDSDFIAVHLYHAERMAYSPELGYKAYYREGSTTRSLSNKQVADYLWMGERMVRFYERIIADSEKREVEEVEKFAESMLEGGCWNMEKACKRIVRLGSLDEIRSYYKRVDSFMDRKALYEDKSIRRYYWNAWMSICIGHKKFAITLLAILIPMYRIFKGCRV